MTAELELCVLQDPSDDHGYITSLAITDELVVAAGGTSSRAPTVLVSSDARHFEVRKTPRQLGLRDVLAVDDELWTCGEYGQLAVSYDLGATWRLFDTGTDDCLFALALVDDAVWVAGDHGYAARIADERIERIDLATTTRLAALYTVDCEVVVLGCDGSLYRSRDGRVRKISTGAAKPLNALAITPLGTWIVVGDGGFIARSPDGTWFSRVKSDVEHDLEGVAVCGEGALIAVGDRATILKSIDDGRTWQPLACELAAHLWTVERFGAGVLIGGDGGLIAKLAPSGDQTWQDRIDVFGGGALDVAFAGGPDAFMAKGLPECLQQLRGSGGPRRADNFGAWYGIALPPEVAKFLARERWSTFDELRFDERFGDAGERNLFELFLASSHAALVDAFCGTFCIGGTEGRDTYHMELYEWDGPRQVLRYDGKRFRGVHADSLDSFVYLAALKLAHARDKISQDAFDIGIRKLHGKIASEGLDPKRRDTEFLFFRSRWIVALLENAGGDEIRSLFDAHFNQAVPKAQLPARYEACERFIPTALYSMWRAYLFDEPELVPYLEVGRRHTARLVRDAAALIDELRDGRNELGMIADVRGWLSAFRALDLDPRQEDKQ